MLSPFLQMTPLTKFEGSVQMRKIIISEKLKSYRYEKGITQRQLADEVGISPQAISKWEREECCPDIALLPVLADAIGCTVDDFFA